MAGLTFSEADQNAMLEAVNQNLTRFRELRAIDIPNDVSPPFHFSALVPGMTLDRRVLPFVRSAPAVKRPAVLEDAAFWPVVQLAQLVKTRHVTATELTRMYLDRLHRYNPLLN